MILRDAEFEKIYLENFKSVYSFLFRLSGSADTAEELTQETFFQAYLSLFRYRGDCAIGTWLCAIAKKLFLKHLRRSKTQTLPIDLFETELAAPETSDPACGVVKKLESERLEKAVLSLPEKYSNVLILRIYGELPYEEIAGRLGISVSSAKVIFFRAKKQIREALENE